MRVFAFIFFLLAYAISATAQEVPRIVSGKADKTALTIYPDNLALITETRAFDLPKGKSTLVFEGVSDRMVPASVLLREFTGMTVERNFDYALLNKASLFEKSIGETVTLTRTHKASGKVMRRRAKIVSAGTGKGGMRYDYQIGRPRYYPSTQINGVVFEVGGKIEVYQCSGLSEGTRFENLPEGLSNVPELSIRVEAEQAGVQEVVISYLADDFSWKADYRLDLSKDEKTAKLAAWITLGNNTAQSFKDVPLAIIAGSLNRDNQTHAPNIVQKSIYANCWPSQSTQTPIALRKHLYNGSANRDNRREKYGSANFAPPAPMMVSENDMLDEVIVTASKRVAQEDFGDYKLSRMAELVTVAAYQTKQVLFLKEPEAQIEKFYTYDVDLYDLDELTEDIDGPEETNIRYDLDNSRDGTLAKPLPRGNVMLMTETRAGKTFLLGETDVKDTAIDNPMKMYMDESFLVQVTTNVTDYSARKDGDDEKITMNIAHKIFNASDVAVRVEINVDHEQALKVDRVSQKKDLDVGPNGWTIFVRPNSSATLKYRATYMD